MDWIKKHYDQFALALLALGLLVFSVMLILRTQSFAESFSAATAPAKPGGPIPPLNEKHIKEAAETLKTPPRWIEEESHSDDGKETRGSLFVSDLYILENGEPVKPGTGARNKDSMTGRAIPNSWFIQYRLPLLESNVTMQDPDKDGFENEYEWRGSDPANPGSQSTDPLNKDSHPPYYTKLFVKQVVKFPFRLLFNAYDGDLKELAKGKVDKFEFQINTLDLRQPTEFLKIGDTIKPHYKIKKFEYKTEKNPSTNEDVDVSELTLTNMETSTDIVLVLNRVKDSPDSFIDFSYEWPDPKTPQVFRVKKLQEFALKPNVNERFKLMDIKEQVDTKSVKAVIQGPDGKSVEIGQKP